MVMLDVSMLLGDVGKRVRRRLKVGMSSVGRVWLTLSDRRRGGWQDGMALVG